MEFTCPVDTLRPHCFALLVAAGVPEQEAEIAAGILLDTSLEGIDTHGVSRLPVYLSCLEKGRINPRPQIKIVKEGAVAKVDGDNGLGQLVAARSMSVAMDLAKEFGVGFVVTRRSNHFGAASYYCKMAAGRGMLGIVLTNAPPAMPPWGGKSAYFGTNPIAFGIPNGGFPVVVDLSSSHVARGNIILAAKEGRPIPLGWAIDKDGQPTTDPQAALEGGAVLPVGGAKGYALALAIEVMTGILSGSAYGDGVGFIYDEKTDPADVSHSFIALDISRIMPENAFLSRMEEMIRGVKAVPVAAGAAGIRVPGEKRYETYQIRVKKGIPMGPSLLHELRQTAARLGVKPLNC
ncbi:Malate/L-lactate dehydrogenase [Acididesulfobacillus acetoxydans]|uniref:L-sulfolactate dehydrogenase n=1 Tax=Acididesulfobacillus acetoxydans TaxID=1561005 RepID=A0A8S0WI36_9FIRM|nr:Ldh family oxidoreductase [Acididesulfobacillus acetoxydans]CAA7603082.1 Malate/L-lactate dehydrogenase [Acididesulfobacillus acetoxydans]CEJ05680.1 L-sulfolactate dehydrogenase [Acididesulfobacillus acetoxydans]